MRIVVIGGGFVGQLIQHAIPRARLLDWRKTAPANHLDTRVGPQYLWEPIPGVPSEQFVVTTLVDGVEPTPERILAYKQKIGKEDDGGDWGLQFQHKMTGWNSPLPTPRVEYNRQVTVVDVINRRLELSTGAQIYYDILINTIPLNAFVLLVKPTITTKPFRFDPIYMSTHTTDSVATGMVLNYLSDPRSPNYRETFHNGTVFYESLVPNHGSRRLMPGKIHAHPATTNVLDELRHFDVYCFGRYAAWRPDELAHQTWQEIAIWKKEGVWTY